MNVRLMCEHRFNSVHTMYIYQDIYQDISNLNRIITIRPWDYLIVVTQYTFIINQSRSRIRPAINGQFHLLTQFLCYIKPHIMSVHYIYDSKSGALSVFACTFFIIGWLILFAPSCFFNWRSHTVPWILPAYINFVHLILLFLN